MRTIGVATFARSEYSSLLPILRAIKADPDLELYLIVSGMHLSAEFGHTVREIEEDGFEINDRVEMLLSSDTSEGIAKTIGLGMIGFAQSFARFQPDILLLVGDRTELLAVASAAMPFRIPIAHVSGGDITEGAVDNQVRHALSKLSQLHFVAMEAHAHRLMQMGEESWRVIVSGDPALDLIHQIEFSNRKDLEKRLELELKPPVLLVTYHPNTLGSTGTRNEVDKLLAALAQIEGALIFTYPNADTESRVIIDRVTAFAESHPGTGLFSNLGQQTYYSLMAQADLMVGNSSSGIWEAPSFQLPVVNIGERQRGRLRVANVIDVAADSDAIVRAIQQGLDPSFRSVLHDLKNPYGDGQAAAIIVDALKDIDPGPRLLQKRFVDLPAGGGTADDDS